MEPRNGSHSSLVTRDRFTFAARTDRCSDSFLSPSKHRQTGQAHISRKVQTAVHQLFASRTADMTSPQAQEYRAPLLFSTQPTCSWVYSQYHSITPTTVSSITVLHGILWGYETSTEKRLVALCALRCLRTFATTTTTIKTTQWSYYTTVLIVWYF